MASNRLVLVDFEVLGKVQGVFFRKNTKEKAQRLGLVGWVRNTEKKTVAGKIQGPAEQTERMSRLVVQANSDTGYLAISNRPGTALLRLLGVS